MSNPKLTDYHMLGWYMKNPCPDYDGVPVTVNVLQVKRLIRMYVNNILDNCMPRTREELRRPDLFLGNAGIAYMFWKLARSHFTSDMFPAMSYARVFINNAKSHYKLYQRPFAQQYSFLRGIAGIRAVSAAISHELGNSKEVATDIVDFREGIENCMEFVSRNYGCDELSIGRAGYLAGCYWLNAIFHRQVISNYEILSICQLLLLSGREYAKKHNCPIPLMYQYRKKEYLGAANGLSSILLMLLKSPWFNENREIRAIATIELIDIKRSVDFFLTLQDGDGNFPIYMECMGSMVADKESKEPRHLVEWCHGASGIVLLLLKAYLVYNEYKYLHAARRTADLVWVKGILRNGPGLCHGIAGNGYVFLLLYRLTKEHKYLYRAIKFMELLTIFDIKPTKNNLLRPYSLYGGIAGTVCFLIDLLEPKKANFPFMEIFE